MEPRPRAVLHVTANQLRLSESARALSEPCLFLRPYWAGILGQTIEKDNRKRQQPQTKNTNHNPKTKTTNQKHKPKTQTTNQKPQTTKHRLQRHRGTKRGAQANRVVRLQIGCAGPPADPHTMANAGHVPRPARPRLCRNELRGNPAPFQRLPSEAPLYSSNPRISQPAATGIWQFCFCFFCSLFPRARRS
ncbi:hypothetical protein METBIDRAFT_147803 [Metschnikowia bicuspidata var. bicuspidata NRRL YB-4993]|uniref:Uncharacterized protein n=1 Tax=Metschnikowia bicuspidata var. bicuspidata NRRL YB-4993 TaxID=869754 RepID=A0A1A0HDK5_9ASCO|nr:hypothetical protein METBIDRAFT_147803 [Metschnikowia bicuspidata var. bicuspidata NRRL YB-4993]OBA22169.1 hypothetical protein METBIDRAFT_147803 [Metschnikowia bicuspidata var. bicuspidata NRRL YB-4993]